MLIAGVSTRLGGRLAQSLEREDTIEAIVGVDAAEPTVELDRTEFVRVSDRHGLIGRIIDGAGIDTFVDTRLIVDSATTSSGEAHESNVIGTMNILAACAGPDSPIRRFVIRSSAHYYGCEQDDPAFFSERMSRPHPPRTRLERDIVEAESAVADYADKHPDVAVAVLRCADVLGPEVRTSHRRMLDLPVVPMVLGFDPRCQFVHEDDVVRALRFVALGGHRGIFNVAGDGVLALSEVISLLGKRPAPVLPPWGSRALSGALRTLGLRIPGELLNQLRFGRGLDNRRLKAAGFGYEYTTRETVLRLAAHQRLHPVVRGVDGGYRYEREVEEFLRRSPLVEQRRHGADRGDGGTVGT